MGRRHLRELAAGLALLLLGGCVSSPGEPVRPPPPASAPIRNTPYTIIGLESVIGRNARFLEAQFGRPVLDIREGSARKLQFAGAACTLDAYLYPPRAGGDPIVTHVDARLPDGRDFDRASCVAALGQAALGR
jgi:hypothetical protein